MASSGRLEAWWGIAKAIAYELRPFTIPSKDDLKNAAKALEINAKQLWAEGRRLAPEILETAKSVNPLRALSVLAWLCGWAIFTWIEFGEEVEESWWIRSGKSSPVVTQFNITYHWPFKPQRVTPRRQSVTSVVHLERRISTRHFTNTLRQRRDRCSR